ncbi:MAG: RsmB/NOP family class I SAM-dependent RNA methyltransferase [Lachnospiraceae bacterium]|nr:RsmB/NOP family class I SAM-dependent RNA methyltransferase [Lachnospiraceae bacterium]
MHEFLFKKLINTYDDNTATKIVDGLKCDKKTTFRVNHIKSTCDEVENELKSQSIPYEKFDNTDGSNIIIIDVYIIDSDFKSNLENLNIYKEGKIYLQSISSMLPAYLLDPKAKENILDMCAAPGSKTTLIQSIANNKVSLTAVELHKDRYERLKYNLELQGANAYTFNMNAIDLDDNFKFDKILIDAPCSGSGILDINNNYYEKYFTEGLIARCVKTQKNLIKKASKLLNVDGIVVYSTCSLLKEENEDIVNYAKGCGFENANLSTIPSSNQNENYIKVFPDSIYEGFFIAKLIKK